MSDWIKMRSALLQAPKVIAMGRLLHGNRAFRDWLTPGGGGPMNGQLVSDDALRCVTAALLLRVWSSSREHGKFTGDDLFLPCITIADLDVMSGVEGFGEAMAKVGWAVEREDGSGVVLPNFKEHNVPKDAAERMKAHRDRKKAEAEKRYAPLRGVRNTDGENVTPRREERRGEEEPNGSSPLTPRRGADASEPKSAKAWSQAEVSEGKAVIAAWNETPDVVQVSSPLAANRKRSLRARLRDAFWRENWRAALGKVAASGFCRGQNDRDWRATFDWFVKPSTVQRLMEGQYAGNAARAGPKANGKPPQDRYAGNRAFAERFNAPAQAERADGPADGGDGPRLLRG